MRREKCKWKPHEHESINARHRGGATRSSDKGFVMRPERRGGIAQFYRKDNSENQRRILLKETKSFEITKRQVYEAYKRVKLNKGGAGIDGESIKGFEEDLSNNLYKIWNRLASGSYFPPPVRRVEIPKGDGRMRPLGIPTVGDRIAQMVVKEALEPELEPYFHKDSYGYRPSKSAHQALEQTRKRCWRYDWVLDLDIKGFFDNIDHDLLMRAVRKHTDCKWMLLYIDRWLKAPVQLPDGSLHHPQKGTPQGGVISPLLANLFLHYAFDMWMQRYSPSIPFERYADDAVCHCKSERQAQWLKRTLERRFAKAGLMLHPKKTKVVYCKDEDRKGSYLHESFDFLGYTFRPRRSKNRWGKYFINFSPAISNKAAKCIRDTAKSWRWHLRSDKDLEDFANMFNPIIRGWITYYGRFYKSALYPTLRCLDRRLVQWARRKFKRLKRHRRRAEQWLRRVARRQPGLFAHWKLLYGQT